MHDLLTAGPRDITRHGVRFQGVLVAGRRGPGHAHFFSSRAEGVCVAALFRGHSSDWPTEAANVCRWAMATLFREPSYEGIEAVGSEPPFDLAVLRAFEEDAANRAMDTSGDPLRMLVEVARRLDELVAALRSPSLGGASGALVALTRERAYVLRRGLARVVRLRAGRAHVLVEVDAFEIEPATIARPSPLFGAVGSPFGSPETPTPGEVFELDASDAIVLMTSVGLGDDACASAPPELRIERLVASAARTDLDNGGGFALLDFPGDVHERPRVRSARGSVALLAHQLLPPYDRWRVGSAAPPREASPNEARASGELVTLRGSVRREGAAWLLDEAHLVDVAIAPGGSRDVSGWLHRGDDGEPELEVFALEEPEAPRITPSALRDRLVESGALPAWSNPVQLKEVSSRTDAAWLTLEAVHKDAGHFEAPTFSGIHLTPLPASVVHNTRYRVEGMFLPDEDAPWIHMHAMEAIGTAPARAIDGHCVRAFRPQVFQRPEHEVAAPPLSPFDVVAFRHGGSEHLVAALTPSARITRPQTRFRSVARALGRTSLPPSLFCLRDPVPEPIDIPFDATAPLNAIFLGLGAEHVVVVRLSGTQLHIESHHARAWVVGPDGVTPLALVASAPSARSATLQLADGQACALVLGAGLDLATLGARSADPEAVLRHWCGRSRYDEASEEASRTLAHGHWGLLWISRA